jgi:DHA1 family putative efflux transporter-like MFS transporter
VISKSSFFDASTLVAMYSWAWSGASLAAVVVINLSGIQSIAVVALMTSLTIVLIQLVSMKKYS